MKISFCTYSSNTDGWRVFGCRPLYAVFARTQLLSRTPGTLNWTAFRKIDGLLQKTLATDAHPQITALLGKKNDLFFYSRVRWLGLLAVKPFGESGHPTARLDLCVLSSFAACTQGGISFISRVSETSVGATSLPDHLTSSCVDRRPRFRPVLQTSTAPPVTERLPGCTFFSVLKKNDIKASGSNLPDDTVNRAEIWRHICQ